MEDFKLEPLSVYDKYLSSGEKEFMHKFFFQKDKDQYLLTRTLMRKILSGRLGKSYDQIQFETNSYGKPFLKNRSKNITFNVSHTEGLIVLAVVENSITIGIDTENYSKKIDFGIRKTFMTDLELEEFDQLPENEQKSRLLNLWTLKESYMKAIGKGFSLSPKSFSFLFNKGEKIQFQENPIESAVNEFSFKLFECSSLYKVALCHTKEISEIGVYRVTPYWEIKNLNISLELFI